MCHQFELHPRNFFDHNPVIDLPAPSPKLGGSILADKSRKKMTEHQFPAQGDEPALARFDAYTRAAIRPLITPSLIAEHEHNPLGKHSDALRRVLDYLRRGRGLTCYVLICTRPHSEWRLARLQDERGKGPVVLDGPAYGSETAAMHALFLKRIEQMMRD